MDTEIDAQLIPHIKSMIEVSFEFAGWNKQEIDKIYIMCSTEEGLFFHFFYAINGNIMYRSKANDFLRKKINVSIEQQGAADKIGLEDLRKIIAFFKGQGKDVPCTIKITYIPATEKMNTAFDYEYKVKGTDLLPDDVMDQWMESERKLLPEPPQTGE